jgi:hypothetical protein
MAKQAGIIKLTGTIGGISFYKHPDDGFLAREKSSLTKEKVFRDPHFKNTLRNADDFKRATAGSMMMRYALHPVLKPMVDGRLNGRMNALFLKTLQSDHINLRGNRRIENGPPGLLEGFNFNRKEKLNDVFPVYCTGHIDTATGNMYTDIPAFVPKNTLEPPAGAKYFKMVSVGVSLDFVTKTPVRYVEETGVYPIDHETVPAFRLQHSVATAAGQFLVLTLGIVFYTLPEDIPADLISVRRRKRLGNGDLPVAYTGAMSILRAVVATEATRPLT